MGYIENTVRAGTHKGSCRKTGSYRGTKGDRKLKTESECKRAGGVTLSLLPNLASESVTAEREGRVVGETDISGLRLLEAHLGLDWAAEGLDLTSSSTTLPHLHPDPCIFILPMHRAYVPQPMHRGLSHKATYTVSTYALSQTHSPTQIHHNHVIFLWTPPHAHSWDVQIHLYRQAHSTRPQHLSSRYTDILLPSIQRAFSRACYGKALGQTLSGG